MTTKTKTHYEVMGVAKTARYEVIKAAFRALSKIYEGMPGGRDSEEYKLISAAWFVLRDEGRRTAYDEELGADVTAGEDLRDAVFTHLREPLGDPDDEQPVDDPLGSGGAGTSSMAGSAWGTPRPSPLTHPVDYAQIRLMPVLHPLRAMHRMETTTKVMLSFFALILTAAFCMITAEVGPHAEWVMAFDLLHFVEKIVWIIGRIIHAFGVFLHAFNKTPPATKP